MHAVFDVRPDSKYRKDFWRRYDLPNATAVKTARACTGDWIVFRQTGIGQYIAVARLEDVVPDPDRLGYFVALVSDYLPFASPVPFNAGERYAEEQFRHIGRSIRIGQAVQGKPVRDLWPFDFIKIVLAGFARTVKVSGNELTVAGGPSGFEDEAGLRWAYEPAPRAIQELFVRRPFRDANFRLEVCGQYGYTCAFTRLSLNDGKLSEVEAAHIWSVADRGPDVVQNALCLSKTVHWAYDHHLISLDEIYRPLVAPDALPSAYLAMFPPPGETIHLPKHLGNWPGKEFLDHHRALFRKKHKL